MISFCNLQPHKTWPLNFGSSRGHIVASTYALSNVDWSSERSLGERVLKYTPIMKNHPALAFKGPAITIISAKIDGKEVLGDIFVRQSSECQALMILSQRFGLIANLDLKSRP